MASIKKEAEKTEKALNRIADELSSDMNTTIHVSISKKSVTGELKLSDIPKNLKLESVLLAIERLYIVPRGHVFWIRMRGDFWKYRYRPVTKEHGEENPYEQVEGTDMVNTWLYASQRKALVFVAARRILEELRRKKRRRPYSISVIDFYENDSKKSS